MSTSKSYATARAWHFVLSALLFVSALGCEPIATPQSDVAEGRQLLETALNEWKAGLDVKAMKTRTPPVFVAEELWEQGFKLSDFMIDGPGEVFGTNVLLSVTLKGTDKTGRQVSRNVKYLVTTTPAMTIARDDR